MANSTLATPDTGVNPIDFEDIDWDDVVSVTGASKNTATCAPFLGCRRVEFSDLQVKDFKNKVTKKSYPLVYATVSHPDVGTFHNVALPKRESDRLIAWSKDRSKDLKVCKFVRDVIGGEGKQENVPHFAPASKTAN